MIGAAAFVLLTLAAAPPEFGAGLQAPPQTEAASEGARHLVFLAEQRPIFVRLRITSQGRPFEAAWVNSVRTLHASLDRNGDGKLTTKEADPKILGAVVHLATGGAGGPTLGEVDVHPKDDLVSIDELAEALRPILGPFRLQVGRQAISRTDALFDQLDRDKDGALTRPELAAIAGSLRPLDLDDNEMITPEELEPFNSPALTALLDESSDRRSRFTALPPVVELVAGESSLRPARLLLKKYDKAAADRPGKLDNKLSLEEFAIDPDVFAKADTNKDDALNTQELREFLARMPIDLTLDVSLSPEASAKSTARVVDGDALPKGAKVRQLADGDLEVAIGQIRIDILLEQGSTAAAETRRVLEQRFKVADTNKNGYLEEKERATIDAPQSPLAGLSVVIDRDGDGKVYLTELLGFGERQAEAARGRLVVTTADQGRAIFGIVDLDRDRRLGAREVMRTVERVMSWDGDGDGHISPDEIPYHFRVTIARGGLPGLTGEVAATAAPRSMVANPSTGPAGGLDWFQKMDRNHDGDVSHREFLGPRDQFDRLDRDKDGLIDDNEARAAVVPKTKDAPKE